MEKVIGEIDKGKTEKIVVRITNWKGKDRIDIREFFMSQRDKKWCPTKKGTAIEIKDLSQILSYLERAEQEVSNGNGN